MSPRKKQTKARKGMSRDLRATRAANAGAKGPRASWKFSSPVQIIAAHKRAGERFAALVALQERLRAPGGCPWDREQTHDTLRTYLIEETYEVLNALDSGDPKELAGELGDLLLQIVFHSELAREAGRFDVADVIENVHDKMVRRHPHVFGNARARTSSEVLKNWEQLKAEEREAAGNRNKPGYSESAPQHASILDGVPRTLPALLEAHQLTRRAANVGFDWPSVEGIFDKLSEETRELRAALAESDRARREEEIGDLLFVAVNLARFLGFDPEIALKRANAKFTARFHEMERAAKASGGQMSKLSAEELDKLWELAKARGKRAAQLGVSR